MVTNGLVGRAGAEAPAFTAEEALTIGTRKGPPEYTLYGVPGGPVRMAADPAGHVFVLVGGNTINEYGPDGRFMRRLGGPGDGPGEFRTAAAMGMVGADELAVYDNFRSRLTILDTGGEVRSVAQVPLLLLRHGFIDRVARLDHESLVMEAVVGFHTPKQPGVEDWTIDLLRVRRNGEIRDTLLSFPGRDVVHFDAPPGAHVSWNTDRPFGRGPRWAVDRNGRIAYGRGNEYVVSIRDADGRMLARMRSSIPSRPVTSEEVETFRRRYPTEVAMDRLDPSSRRLAEEALSRILSSLPKTWPAFDRLRFDAAARLWVRRPPSFDDSTAVWDVYDPTLVYLGWGILPAAMTVQQISESSVYALWRDSDDVVYVKRYDVRWLVPAARERSELKARANRRVPDRMPSSSVAP